MDYLLLSQLIGKEIAELRYHYIPENEYDLQSFHAFIRLSDDTIINIPVFDDDEYLLLNKENTDYFAMQFNTGTAVDDAGKAFFAGQRILDLFFSYYNNETDIDHPAFIKLSNGYYLSENNYGPPGLTNIDLILMDQEQFNKEVKRLNEAGIEVRSYISSEKYKPINT
jgi:hypothetical protein